MKFLIFFRDINGLRTDVPGELIKIAIELSKNYSVTIMGRQANLEDIMEILPVISYENSWNLISELDAYLEKNRPDYIIIAGFFMVDNVLASIVANHHSIPTVLYPMAHAMDLVFRTKIFDQNPDVNKLQSNKNIRARPKRSLKTRINPLLKHIFGMTLGKILVNNAIKIAVFSSEEIKHLSRRYHIETKRFVFLRWGMDKIEEKILITDHFYHQTLKLNDEKLNFIYWGRLDWNLKGIDRLLEGVAILAKRRDSIPFRIFLAGPDYRDTANRIKQFVTHNRLENIVYLLLPGAYTPGSKAPLRDSDASILLSRWDGFPRSLVESCLLGVPVVVSPESNFGDLVTEYKAGITLVDPDNKESVAEALIFLCESIKHSKCREGIQMLKMNLTTEKLCSDFVLALKSFD